MTFREIKSICTREFQEWVKEHWDELMAVCIQQGVMDTYVDYETYLRLNPRGEGNDSLEYEAFGFLKLQEFVKHFKNDRLEYHVKHWHDLQMMPLRTAGYDAELTDELQKRRKVEIKTRLFPITSAMYDLKPESFVEFEEKDLEGIDYILMFFWRPGEHGKVDWALFRADKSILRTENVPSRTKSNNYDEGKKEYPATGFNLNDAGWPDQTMFYGGEKDEAI